jgi:sigma-B regulation protein RsbU (phosphoserine phosphatase)
MGREAGSPDLLNKKVESLTRNLLECYEELDLIYGLSRRGLTGLDIEANVGFILNEAMEIFSGDMGWVVSAEKTHFDPVRVRAPSEIVDRIHKAVVSGFLSQGKSRVLDCLEENGLGDDLSGAFLCSMIRTDETVYGALCVTRKKGKPIFTAGDLKLAGVMASQAAIAIENALLHRRRLEEEQAMIRIQEELRLARSIQQNLLPRVHPSVAGYDISGITLPAQSVGGDYYDLIQAGGSRLAICVGDVSGKGMPAALLMAHLQAAIRGQTLMSATPAECLMRSNKLLFESTDSDRFATCFYGILDPRENSLRFSNAGHDRPLYIADRKVPASLSSAGLVLGIMDGVEYEEMTITFSPGDTFILYSDGIIDAADSEDRAFGLDRFIDCVQEHRRSSAREVVATVLEEVQKHAGGAPQTDDMTLVAVKRKE